MGFSSSGPAQFCHRDPEKYPHKSGMRSLAARSRAVAPRYLQAPGGTARYFLVSSIARPISRSGGSPSPRPRRRYVGRRLRLLGILLRVAGVTADGMLRVPRLLWKMAVSGLGVVCRSDLHLCPGLVYCVRRVRSFHPPPLLFSSLSVLISSKRYRRRAPGFPLGDSRQFRRHSSAAAVEVLAEPEEIAASGGRDNASPVSSSRSSGRGGRNIIFFIFWSC